ncbi:MAG: isoaspartyl peptidase/L-asparaginase family protein [Candidatus Binatia bacterium]|nr:isoaspartyl peptidase/L-asparaginase family protein [Candidatus Binatia bacterium]
MTRRQPALILHGGAGASVPAAQRPLRQQGLERAFAAAWAILQHGGTALDAVVGATVAMENDPEFNAGVGSCLNQDGEVEMDASLMEGTTYRAGAVGAVRHLRNPILVARALMEEGRHVFLVGDGAERFARARGFLPVSREELVTERQLRRWHATRTAGEPGTVGAVALDRAGRVAAATSTGGIFNKHPGRIGDSAVIGAGTYADDTLGAGSATGDGEAIIRATLTRTAVDYLRDGRDPTRAAQAALTLLHRRTHGEAGIVLLDALGRVGYAYNTPAMSLAFLSGDTLVVQV